MSLPMGRMRNISPKSPLINNANRCRSAISYSLLVATTQLPAAAEFFFRFFSPWGHERVASFLSGKCDQK